jgi:glutaredoxin
MAVEDPSSVDVLLYTRAGCHLCDEAKQLLRELQKKAPFEFREVDIDQDPELLKRYNEEVPVVFVHGKKAFKYRIDPGQFLKRLQQLGGGG